MPLAPNQVNAAGQQENIYVNNIYNYSQPTIQVQSDINIADGFNLFINGNQVFSNQITGFQTTAGISNTQAGFTVAINAIPIMYVTSYQTVLSNGANNYILNVAGRTNTLQLAVNKPNTYTFPSGTTVAITGDVDIVGNATVSGTFIIGGIQVATLGVGTPVQAGYVFDV
jgi:hypothetical protein